MIMWQGNDEDMKKLCDWGLDSLTDWGMEELNNWNICFETEEEQKEGTQRMNKG